MYSIDADMEEKHIRRVRIGAAHDQFIALHWAF
jgi:hypothetical protein